MNTCSSACSILLLVALFTLHFEPSASFSYNRIYGNGLTLLQGSETISSTPLFSGARQSFRKRQQLCASNEENDPETFEGNAPMANVFSWIMIGLPVASLVFPQLLQLAKSLPANSSEQFAVVAALFVGNRLYLYAMSATIVALAALRGATDNVNLGERLIDLTEELLFRPSLIESSPEGIMDDNGIGDDGDDRENKEKPAMIQSLRESGLGNSLDDISSESQAFILPVLVSVLLAASVFLLPLWNGSSPLVDEASSFAGFQEIISKIVPKISEVWNIGLLALFTRSELRRLFRELPNTNALDSEMDSSALVIAEWVIAIGITASAFLLQQWPAQNFVNMALAILVSRAIQLDKFTSIIAALSLLTMYDAASVFLIPAAHAMEPTIAASSTVLADATSSSAGAAGSAMGSVAIQKLTSGTFQPGLLTTQIGNSLGGGLGLGDAVFPSILANFARRFDLEQDESSEEGRTSLFAISMGGYLLGCLACEFAPMISSSGIPALVFIIPIMVGSVLISAAVSDEVEELLQFEPGANSRED
jgi:hypothetical protein